MSSLHRVCSCLAVLISLATVAGCASSPPAPDAAPPSTVPSGPAGVFSITSTFDVPVPRVVGAVIAPLKAATDGPDDPSRYLVDRMIATLPDGTVKTFAGRAAPYVAAYLNDRLVEIAPRFVTGIAAIAGGLSRIAGHFGTLETLRIDDSGAALRTITAARFELGAAPVIVRFTPFADGGLADIATAVRVVLDDEGHLEIAEHAHRLPYGALLRLGLDQAVVVGIEPAARDLAGALAALVDCDRLGALVADRIGLGSAALYRAACRAGMTAIASEIDVQLAAIDDTALGLKVTGAARGVDLDGDGTMDELRSGRWSGSLHAAAAAEPIIAASFTGTRAP